MSKRRISRRQAWRIKKIQEERRQRAERWDAQIEEQLTAGSLGPEQPGLLVAHYGKMADIEAKTGEVRRCLLRQNLGLLVAGDQVIWRATPDDRGVVVALSPRKNMLGRPDQQQQMRPIAANIDQVLIVTAAEPHLITSILDSYLIAVESLQLQPMIIFNKVELLSQEQLTQIENILTIYQNINYPILKTSCVTQTGIDELMTLLRDKNNIFIGQSGVGKSSLIAQLLPKETIRVGELSEGSRKGRHTTTTARLYHLQQGGCLIDSPGIREFSLWHMNAQQITRGFTEFKPYLDQCQFRNCLHDTEPHCAIKEAVEKNQISEMRYENYRKLAEID